MQRLSRLAPEEIGAAILLAVALGIALLRPAAIGDLLAPPSPAYATPHPDGGPARQLVPEERPAPSPGALGPIPDVRAFDRTGRPVSTPVLRIRTGPCAELVISRPGPDTGIMLMCSAPGHR